MSSEQIKKDIEKLKEDLEKEVELDEKEVKHAVDTLTDTIELKIQNIENKVSEQVEKIQNDPAVQDTIQTVADLYTESYKPQDHIDSNIKKAPLLYISLILISSLSFGLFVPFFTNNLIRTFNTSVNLTSNLSLYGLNNVTVVNEIPYIPSILLGSLFYLFCHSLLIVYSYVFLGLANSENKSIKDFTKYISMSTPISVVTILVALFMSFISYKISFILYLLSIIVFLINLGETFKNYLNSKNRLTVFYPLIIMLTVITVLIIMLKLFLNI